MPKYHDIKIARHLSDSRIKWDFSAYAEKHLGYSWDGSSEQKLSLLMQYHEKSESGDSIFQLEMELLPVLAEMEAIGVRIDREKLSDIGERIIEAIKLREQEIYDLVWERFNINSPKQIQTILFEKLHIPPTKKNKTGYSVDNEVLESIAENYAIAGLILEYRSLAKLSSTYIEWLTKAIHPQTKRIHTDYNQTGTTTGRLSSENPNLQNIPSSPGYPEEIKSCFIPSEGNIFIVADYSQVELRVLAMLSGDENLIEAFRAWEDIHTRTARYLFGKDQTITSDMRRIAKSVNFWVIYGITGFWLSKMIKKSPAESTEYIKRFFDTYPKVDSYYQHLLSNARETGYVETYFWRKRYIKWLNDANKTMRSIAEREAMNMPIQWTAADVMKYAMLAIQKGKNEKNLNWNMILQVHDELVFDVPKHEEETWLELVRESMEWVLGLHGVSLKVDIHTGKNWHDAKG